MKQTVAMLLLASLPGLVLASGDHGGHSHGSKSKKMQAMPMAMEEAHF